MTITAQPLPDRPDPTVIAAQNDAFRKLACLGVPPAQPIQGRMHVTRSLMEAGDGFMAEAVDDHHPQRACFKQKIWCNEKCGDEVDQVCGEGYSTNHTRNHPVWGGVFPLQSAMHGEHTRQQR